MLSTFDPIIKFGPRPSFEMEQVLPGADPHNFEMDPIIEASRANQAGDRELAYKIMEEILVADLRCLDAHAHLGNWSLPEKDVSVNNFELERAKRHYEIGVQIGKLTFGSDFRGVLRWGHIDNRPFLRCLHGYGLCLWRTGQVEAARAVFDWMLWLNPSDNQGVRFLIHDIDDEQSWTPET